MTSYDLFHVLTSLEPDESITFRVDKNGSLQLFVEKQARLVDQTVTASLMGDVPDKQAWFAMQISDMLGHLRRGAGREPSVGVDVPPGS